MLAIKPSCNSFELPIRLKTVVLPILLLLLLFSFQLNYSLILFYFDFILLKFSIESVWFSSIFKLLARRISIIFCLVFFSVQSNGNSIENKTKISLSFSLSLSLYIFLFLSLSFFRILCSFYIIDFAHSSVFHFLSSTLFLNSLSFLLTFPQ